MDDSDKVKDEVLFWLSLDISPHSRLRHRASQLEYRVLYRSPDFATAYCAERVINPVNIIHIHARDIGKKFERL